ncbi:hypothetical protein [Bradyrhizobium liaoningense]|uniref:hypothetical protein n=1 Tax=Bradyrhizobium liaoningense TaxID=43992 RepID=UPI001BA5035D|nr:hypothetical protein [Bradyrhizobium liaoningense]MBR0719145.1 hypothetical protein [Bradyrhizobium liaoningense]
MIASDDLFQGRPVTHDADGMVVDLHPIHHGLDIGLPERNRAGGDVFPHEPAEPLDGLVVEILRRWSQFDAVQGLLGPIAVGLESRQAVFQDVVQFGEAVFHHRVETLQLVFGSSQLRPQIGHPLIDFGRLF